MHVGGCSSNPSNRSLLLFRRTESRNPIPRTVRPSAAGAVPPRDAHVQGGAPGGGLLGPAARPGGGVAARGVVYSFGVRPSLYIATRGMASTLEAIRTLHPYSIWITSEWTPFLLSARPYRFTYTWTRPESHPV